MEPRAQDNEEAVKAFRRTHAAYLALLGDPAALDEARGRDVTRVSRWLSAGGLRTEWILASASSQFAPVRSRDFWGWDGPLQVDAPFTGRAWNDAIQPLTQGLRALAPNAADVRDAVARFERDYRVEAMRQWGQFLAAFSQEERVLGGRRGSRDLAVRSLEAESPYRRVLDQAAADIGAIAGASRGDAGELPALATTLLRYAALRRMAASPAPAAGQKPGDPKAQYTDAERQAMGYVKAYDEALDKLRGELGGPEKAYASVQKVFEEGESSERSGHPVHRALGNLKALRSMIGARQGDDRVVWDLLARPVELGVADDAGRGRPAGAGRVGSHDSRPHRPHPGPAGRQDHRVRQRARRALARSVEGSVRGAPLPRRGRAPVPGVRRLHLAIRWMPPDRLDKIEPPRLITLS